MTGSRSLHFLATTPHEPAAIRIRSTSDDSERHSVNIAGIEYRASTSCVVEAAPGATLRPAPPLEMPSGAESGQRPVHLPTVTFAACRPAALVVVKGGEKPEAGTYLGFPGHDVDRAGECPD